MDDAIADGAGAPGESLDDETLLNDIDRCRVHLLELEAREHEYARANREDEAAGRHDDARFRRVFLKKWREDIAYEREMIARLEGVARRRGLSEDRIDPPGVIQVVVRRLVAGALRLVDTPADPRARN